MICSFIVGILFCLFEQFDGMTMVLFPADTNVTVMDRRIYADETAGRLFVIALS